jgi:transcriptional regulator NrdR family protein
MQMTIDDYRVQFGWSKAHMAREAGIDVNTLRSAINGNPVYRAKVGQVTEAINRELKRRGEQPIKYTDLAGVVFAD